MPSPLETWFLEIPPITRIYVSAACCTSLAVHLGFIHPIQLWLNYEGIVHDFQWWRLITNFFYFGPLSIDFCFHVFFLARYSRMMEEGFFRNKPADYVWLMLFSASVLIVLSIIVPFAHLPFMGSALSFTMVYIWARRNPYVRLNFLGLIVFTAPYLPWVLLIFSLCLGGQVPVGDILGVLVGHIYYFFEDVWPRDPISNGKKWLATPRLIRWLIEGNRARGDDSIEINTNEADREILVEEDENIIDNNESEPLLNDIVEASEPEMVDNESPTSVKMEEKPYLVDSITEKEGGSFENVDTRIPLGASTTNKESSSSIPSCSASNINTTPTYNTSSNNISVDKTVSDNKSDTPSD